MTEAKEMREKIIAIIQTLPEEKLKEVDAVITKVLSGEKHSIEHIYSEAVKKYDDTLKKLAQ